MKHLFGRMFGALLLVAGMLSAATPERVEQYLTISGAEDQLIQFEQIMDGMNTAFVQNMGIDPVIQDTQLIGIRFREYLQKHLSDSEMDEILANYQTEVMRKVVSTQVALLQSPDTFRTFIQQQATDPLPKANREAARAISKEMNDAETVKRFLKSLMDPVMKHLAPLTGKTIDKKAYDTMIDRMIAQLEESSYYLLLYVTQDFSDEEFRELERIAKSSATRHETRTMYDAIAYAIGEAFDSMIMQLETKLRARSVRKPVPATTSPKQDASKRAPAQSTN
jgi:hypothetical protein